MENIKNIIIGDYNFHLYSIKIEGGKVRGIEITDAFVGNENIGFNKKLSITFTDTHLFEDEILKNKNKKNIENLKILSDFIKNEINN